MNSHILPDISWLIPNNNNGIKCFMLNETKHYVTQLSGFAIGSYQSSRMSRKNII